jgi:Tfp pilus assembly protein PilF
VDDSLRERIEGLTELLDEEPEDVTTRFMLATELAKAGDHATAAAHFAELLTRDADYTAAYRGLGRARVAMGDLTGAREVFTRGLAVAERTGDLQSGREMAALLRRHVDGRDEGGGTP